MSRILSHILLRRSMNFQWISGVPLTGHCRYCSSGKTKFIEIGLSDSASSSSCSKSDGVDEVMSKLEELMHRMIVQRSTPDWLPFVPGSSFWVPSSTLRYRSRRNSDSSEGNPVASLLDFIGKLPTPLFEEDQLSHSMSRTWPSSSYFFAGNAPIHLPELDVEQVTEPEAVTAPELKMMVVVECTVKEVAENWPNDQSENEE